MNTSKTSPYKVQVLDRTLAIVDTLAAVPSLSLTEISAQVRLHKSTVHRLLNVLEQHRYVERFGDGRYRLGLRLFELGSVVTRRLDLRERARPLLERLSAQISETVHLCVLDRGEVLYIDKVEPERSVRMASTIGARIPAYCSAVGKAMLAYLPESEINEIVAACPLKARTRHTLSTPADLKRALAEVRARGFALDNEENEEGVRCVGAVVRNHAGAIAGAISISAPAFRFPDAKLKEYAAAVTKTAAAISAELGYATKQAAAGD